MSEKPETVIHVAGEVYESADDEGQWCEQCDFLLCHASPGWPEPWQRGDLVAVRIDETPKDGFIVGYWKVEPDAPLADDERRCTVRE